MESLRQPWRQTKKWREVRGTARREVDSKRERDAYEELTTGRAVDALRPTYLAAPLIAFLIGQVERVSSQLQVRCDFVGKRRVDIGRRIASKAVGQFRLERQCDQIFVTIGN